MKRVALGSTGLQVSPLGLGTVKLGRNQGVKYPQQFQIPDDASARTLLNLARDLGINLIDTAPAYGTSEERLGQLLHGQWDDWVLCTKVGEEFEQGLSRYDFSATHVRYSVDRSLQRLRTDTLDLVLAHSDGNDLVNIQEHGVLETLADLRKEGKLRSFGMSTKTVEGGLLALQQSDVAMITLNLSEQAEAVVAAQAAQTGKGVLVKKALASGHVCDPGDDGDPVQRSFDYLFRLPGVNAAIIGTITPKHLRHNVDCLERALAENS